MNSVQNQEILIARLIKATGIKGKHIRAYLTELGMSCIFGMEENVTPQKYKDKIEEVINRSMMKNVSDTLRGWYKEGRKNVN